MTEDKQKLQKVWSGMDALLDAKKKLVEGNRKVLANDYGRVHEELRF